MIAERNLDTLGLYINFKICSRRTRLDRTVNTVSSTLNFNRIGVVGKVLSLIPTPGELYRQLDECFYQETPLFVLKRFLSA